MRPAAALPLLSIGLVLAACASEATVTPVAATPVTTAAPTGATTVAVVDPYDVYLSIAPAGSPDLDREEAQLRAMLGCRITYAPGTTDAALQQAYASFIDQWRQQGLCDTKE